MEQYEVDHNAEKKRTVTLNELKELVENLPEGTIIHVEFVKEGDDDDGK